MAYNLSKKGNTIVQVMDLDNSALPFLKNENNEIFLKMDVEGAELETIIGASELIAKKSINLAVSIYNRPDDIFEIPILINKINSNYEFFLRQHGNDTMDLVLYCKPKER